MASVDSSWISWGVGVFILKPLKWTLSSVLGDSKIPEEDEVLIYVELLQVSVESSAEVVHSRKMQAEQIFIAAPELFRSLEGGGWSDLGMGSDLDLLVFLENKGAAPRAGEEKLQGDLRASFRA